MSLRDLGNSFADWLNSIAEDFHVAATQSFLDWPLWLSIPVCIGVSWFVLWLLASHVRDMRGQRATLMSSIGFTVAAMACAYVSYDVWFRGTIFDGDQRWLRLLQIGYPIMTTIFGFAGLFGFASRWRNEPDNTK